MTHAYAILDVSAATFDEIKRRLKKANYAHAFHDDVIDMHGIALKVIPLPSGTIQDWATRAAQYISQQKVARNAAVIATFAEPWMKLLRESKHSHVVGCPKYDYDDIFDKDDTCTCGADAWNARVDEALS